jgi:hypothetical protein
LVIRQRCAAQLHSPIDYRAKVGMASSGIELGSRYIITNKWARRHDARHGERILLFYLKVACPSHTKHETRKITDTFSSHHIPSPIAKMESLDHDKNPLIATIDNSKRPKRQWLKRRSCPRLSCCQVFLIALAILFILGLAAVVGVLARFNVVLKNEMAAMDGQGIDADTFARFNRFEQFAAAAYCRENNNSTKTRIKCQAGNCPLVEQADTWTVVEFEK